VENHARVTVERRGQIVLIGIKRPQMFNRIDPDTFYGFAKAYAAADLPRPIKARRPNKKITLRMSKTKEQWTISSLHEKRWFQEG
jgi:hypothetical protein